MSGRVVGVGRSKIWERESDELDKCVCRIEWYIRVVRRIESGEREEMSEREAKRRGRKDETNELKMLLISIFDID